MLTSGLLFSYISEGPKPELSFVVENAAWDFSGGSFSFLRLIWRSVMGRNGAQLARGGRLVRRKCRSLYKRLVECVPWPVDTQRDVFDELFIVNREPYIFKARTISSVIQMKVISSAWPVAKQTLLAQLWCQLCYCSTYLRGLHLPKNQYIKTI